MGMKAKKSHFSCSVHKRVREEKREEKEKLQLLSMIYEVRLLSFRQAEN